MNSIKSAVGPINSSKNKLNGEIIYNFNCFPNAHLVSDKHATMVWNVGMNLIKSWNYLMS